MGIAGEIAEDIRDSIDRVTDTATETAQEVGENLREGFQAGTEALREIIEEAWEQGVKVPLDNAIEKIKDIGEIVLDVQEQAQEILEAIGQKLLEELLEYLSTLSIIVELRAEGYARIEVSTSLFSAEVEFDICQGFTYNFKLLYWTRLNLFNNIDNGLIKFKVEIHDKLITNSWIGLKFAIPTTPIPEMMRKQCKKEEEEEEGKEEEDGNEGETTTPPGGIKCFNASDTLKGGNTDEESKESFSSFLRDIEKATGGGTRKGGDGGGWGSGSEGLSNCPRIIEIGMIQNIYGDASDDRWGKNRTYEEEFFLYPERWGGSILSWYVGGTNPDQETLQDNQLFWQEMIGYQDTEWWIVPETRESLQACINNLPDRECDQTQETTPETTPEKIPDLPLMDEECCSLLRQVLDRLGGEDFQATLPQSLTEGDSNVNVSTIPEMLAKQIEYQDELAGSYPVEIEIEDSDLTQEGNQSIKLDFPNQSELLAESYGLMYEILKNLTVTQELTYKAMLISGLNRQALIKLMAKVETIQDFLDFKVDQEERKFNSLFCPGEQDWDAILKECETVVKVEEFDQNQRTLSEQLLELMQGAAIIRARYFQKVTDKFDFLSVLKEGASLAPDLLEKVRQSGGDWSKWKDWIEDELMKKHEQGDIRPDIKEDNPQ